MIAVLGIATIRLRIAMMFPMETCILAEYMAGDKECNLDECNRQLLKPDFAVGAVEEVPIPHSKQ